MRAALLCPARIPIKRASRSHKAFAAAIAETNRFQLRCSLPETVI